MKNFFLRVLPSVLILFVLLSAAGCKTTSQSTPPPSTGGIVAGAAVIVQSNQPTVSNIAQATITATVTDATGQLAADGTQVTFTLDTSSKGTLSNGGIATTTNGTAIVTFTPTAGSTGNVTVSAASGSISGSTTLTVFSSTAQMFIGISASPASIAAGGVATITAHVVDNSGNAVPDNTLVTFSLDSGLKGTLSKATEITTNGDAVVTLTGGTASTVVVVTAAVGSATANTSVTISGGTSTSGSMTVATSASSIAPGINATITATLKDSQGNFVPDGTLVTFTLSDATMGTLSGYYYNNGAVPTGNYYYYYNGGPGQAVVTFTPAFGKTGNVIITATSGSLSAPVTITVTTAPQINIGLTASPSSIASGQTSTITAHVVDSSGNPVPDNTVVTFSLDNGLKGVLSMATLGTTNGDAVVTFIGGNTNTVAVVTATIGSATGNISVNITGGSSSSGTMTVTANPINIAPGVNSNITVKMVDQQGNPYPDGTQVTFTLSDPTLGTLSGINYYSGLSTIDTYYYGAGQTAVRFSAAFGKTGTVTITAASGSLSGSANITVTTASLINVGLVTSLATVASGGTSTITAHVVDNTGNIVPDGTVVTFNLDNGLKGTLSSGTQVTTNGNASVRFTAGAYNTVAAITATIGSVSNSANVAITGGAAASVLVSASTTSISAGGTSAITATVKDSLNLPVSGASVVFSLSDPTKATLSVTTVTSDANGVATATVTGTAGPFVTVFATTLGVTNFASINILGSGSVGSISLSAAPTSVTIGGATVVTALVRDASNQPVPTGSTVTFSLSNATAGALSVASATTNASGVASVTFTAGATPTSVSVTAAYAALGLSSSVNVAITAPPPANIAATATPAVITARGTTSITAVITDATAAAVLDGTTVNFTLSDSSFGSLSNTTSSTSGGTGTATITFTATSKTGAVTISVIAGTITKTISVTINPAPTGSIQFISAAPQVVGIKGSGQIETSSVTFLVNDINGNPVSDGTSVTFTLQGPGGGAYIGSTPGSLTSTGSTVNGNATVILNSGTVAGPVTITASTVIAGGITISSSAGQISIGGGVPSATHINLATSKFNLPGFVVSGATANISVYIGDRFGNYNVLQGTSVSFYTEAGSINRQGTTDATGLATTTFRTQDPNPATVAATGSEVAGINALNATYALGIITPNPTVHPRNGWEKVLATVQGEESFLDENGDGLFTNNLGAVAGATVCPTGYTCECHDSTTGAYLSSVTTGIACPAGLRSEAFLDMGEPFIDVNDDGCRNDGNFVNCTGTPAASSDPFELFIDASGDGAYNPPNGIWDGPSCTTTGCLTSKMIWKDITLAFTGNASYCKLSAANSSAQFGGSTGSISFMAGDFNTNNLAPGTTITVSSTGGGTLSGTTSYTVPDGVPNGPTQISFSLAAPSCSAATPPACPDPVVQDSITVSMSSNSVVPCPPQTIYGTFHP